MNLNTIWQKSLFTCLFSLTRTDTHTQTILFSSVAHRCSLSGWSPGFGKRFEVSSQWRALKSWRFSVAGPELWAATEPSIWKGKNKHAYIGVWNIELFSPAVLWPFFLDNCGCKLHFDSFFWICIAYFSHSINIFICYMLLFQNLIPSKSWACLSNIWVNWEKDWLWAQRTWVVFSLIFLS